MRLIMHFDSDVTCSVSMTKFCYFSENVTMVRDYVALLRGNSSELGAKEANLIPSWFLTIDNL